MTDLYQLRGTVAVITMSNPPVNGLGFDLRRQIVASLDAAFADPGVQAVVLIGSERAFSGGADIREFNTPKALAEPTIQSVIRVIEAAAKPVIAAVGGLAMGGGLELALGCHFRVAAPGAQIALPEVKLGILPGAGGTQRLPRAVGIETALNMIVSGNPLPSEALAASGLFDGMVEGDLLEGALAFAGRVLSEQRPLKRVRDIRIDYPNAEAFFQFARNTVGALAKNYPAPLKCIDAVQAAVTKPFDDGIAFERECFVNLVQTTESKALRHAFFGERAAAKIPDVPDDTPTRRIAHVAVIGAGTMGRDIALSFLAAGLPVTMLEANQQALDEGLAAMRKTLEGAAQKGRISADALEKQLALIKTTLSYDGIQGADLVIEAVFEDLGVKQQVFEKIDQAAKPGAILATNTSTLDVDRIAGFTRRPADVLGLHFFSPAHIMKLVEVVRGAATAKDVLATVMRLAKKIGKTAVVAGVCDGFIGNRMIEQYLRQALFLLEEGATPHQVDQALEKWGMAMGPFRMSDLAGNDIGWAIRKRRSVEQPHIVYSRIADLLCEQGRFGQKVGRGWHAYPAGRDAVPDPEVERLIADYRQERGMPSRQVGDAEIIERCIFALVNEGARILEEGIALRASDIDMVYLTGYGFPVYRGGPMFHADTVGLFNVARAMRRYAETVAADPGFWQPAPLLARLAAESKSFN